MAKPFGYIDASDRRTGNYVNSFYADYPVMDFGPNAEDTFNAFLIHLGFYKIQDAVKVVDTSIRSLLKIKIGDASQGGSFLYYSQINWSNYNNTSNSIHLQLDSSLIYRYQGYVYDYDYNSPERSSIPTVEYKWCNKYLKIKDMAITNNGYQNNKKDIQNGFGHWPRNVSYTYLDGAFDDRELKPLQNRMQYKLQYDKSNYLLRVFVKKFSVTYGSTDFNISSEWVQTCSYNFSRDKDPIICIDVCQPANSSNQPDGPSFDSSLKTFYCGDTERYFINCNDLDDDLLICCSDIISESCYPRRPYGFNGYNSESARDYGTEANPYYYTWEQNRKEDLLFFTSPRITISHYLQKQTFKDDDFYFYFTFNFKVANKDQIISSSYSGPSVPVLSAKYMIPYFYKLYEEFLNDTPSCISDFVLSHSNELIWNDNKHYRGFLHLIQNDVNTYNYPGLGDFKQVYFSTAYNDIQGKKQFYHPVYNGSYDARLEYDQHSWDLKPYLTYENTLGSVSWYSEFNLLLPSAAWYYYKVQDSQDITDAGTQYNSWSRDIAIQWQPAVWMKRQNMWGAPIMSAPTTFDMNPYATSSGFDNCRDHIKGIFNISETYFRYSYYRLTPAIFGSTSYSNFLSWNLSSYKNCGANILSWWKNTTSIPGNENSDTELLTTYVANRESTHYRVVSDRTYRPDHTPYSGEGDTREAINKYLYIYPQSSQAPGAIAIYAITW